MSQTGQQRRRRTQPAISTRRRFVTAAYFVIGVVLGAAGLKAVGHWNGVPSARPTPNDSRAYAYVSNLLAHSTTPLLQLPHRNWFVVTQNGRRTLVVIPRGDISTAHRSGGAR